MGARQVSKPVPKIGTLEQRVSYWEERALYAEGLLKRIQQALDTHVVGDELVGIAEHSCDYERKFARILKNRENAWPWNLDVDLEDE